MPKLNVMGPDARIIIKYSGLIDLQKVLEDIKKWYDKRQFEFHEYSYKSREKQHGGLEMFWSGWRDDTDYFRIWFHCYIKLWDNQDVEVISGGVKKKMVKGRMRINLRLVLETDYRHKWEGSRFFVLLRDFYDAMIRMKIYGYADKTEWEMDGFVNYIKRSIGMVNG